MVLEKIEHSFVNDPQSLLLILHKKSNSNVKPKNIKSRKNI